LAGLKKLSSIEIHRPGSGYPKKNAINLLRQEKDPSRSVFELIVFGLFLVVLAIATKFLVIDQIQKVNTAESAYNRAQDTLEQLRDANNVYNDVNSQYVHYGDGDLTSEESARQDRAKMMEVIDQYVVVDSGIQSISIEDNTATLIIDRTTLSEVAGVVSSLRQSDIVSYVSPSTATNEENDGTVTAQIVVTFESPVSTDNTEEKSSESLSDQMADRKLQTETEGMEN
jgi:hypothetical protein